MESNNDTQILSQFQGNVVKENEAILKLNVERPVLEQEDLYQLYQYEQPKITVIDKFKNSVGSTNCQKYIKNVIPFYNWIRKYKWRKDFIYDVISGITVAIMHIPQGMAYAMLGNVSPVVGLYMAFFPVLIYVFFGTSRHVSMGTFAVVCLMTGRVVNLYATPVQDLEKGHDMYENSQNIEKYTPIEVATTVTFMVGIIQLIMYIFRMGVISTLLSETFVSGFTTGAAIHVLSSQIFDLLGLVSNKPTGYFKFIKTIVVIFNDIPNINTAAIIISVVTCSLMILHNELFKSWIEKKCNFPIPVELIAVITGTIVSRYCDFATRYSIKTVGHIPIGLPEPKLPVFKLLPNVVLEAIEITMVSYTITMSMSLIFAKKLHYDINFNQELFAMGSGNIFGAFFSCMPVSASLSRSFIQESVGGKTQIASVVSCFILLIILLWIGPFFEPLPRCILASIIVVALKGMLWQIKSLIKFWKLNKADGIVWFVTFLATALLAIDVGLIVGLLASIMSVFIQNERSYSCLLGHVPNTELYLDTSRYIGVAEIFGIKIYHYSGSLNFVNSGQLQADVEKKVGVNPQQVFKYREKLGKTSLYSDANDFENKYTLKCIVIDMSALNVIDSSGVVTLHDIVIDFARIDIPVFLANCNTRVYDTIQKCDMMKKNKSPIITFASVHDAVFFAQRELVSKSA